MIKETKISMKELEKRLNDGLIHANHFMEQIATGRNVTLVNGSLCYYRDEEGKEYYHLHEIPDEILDSEEYEEIPYVIYQYYLLSENDADYIIDHTDLIVLHALDQDLFFYGRTNCNVDLKDTYLTFYEYIDEE